MAVSKKTNLKGNGIELIISHFYEFANENPSAIMVYKKYDEIITEGSAGDTIYLILEGYADIIVTKHEKDITVATRSGGQVVGESGLLNRNKPRNATVRVMSDELKAVCLSREDVLSIAAGKSNFKDAFSSLWSLERERLMETRSITANHYAVKSEFLTVVIADLHKFTYLSNRIYEELMENFLYEFIETSSDICKSFNSQFEDQGDGFKLIVRGSDSANVAINCSLALIQNFLILRDTWSAQQVDLRELGLGLGIVTDFMSIRYRMGTGHMHPRIISSTINNASRMSKTKASHDGIDFLIDETTRNCMHNDMKEFFRKTSVLIEEIGINIDAYRYTKIKDFFFSSKDNFLHEQKLVPQEGQNRPAIYEHLDAPMVDPSLVFICHNSDDKDEARKVNAYLKESDIDTWFDEEKVGPGDLWQDQLENVLDSISSCLILVGGSGFGPWQQAEVRAFIDEFVNRRCRIIPVILSGVTDVPDLPLFLKGFQRIDLRVNEALGLLSIAKTLGGIDET